MAVTPGLRPADALARPFPLCALPTPLMGAPRLARALGLRSLHVKRDDLTGFAVAGNRPAKLEFLLGDALGRWCDVLLTGGGRFQLLRCGRRSSRRARAPGAPRRTSCGP